MKEIIEFMSSVPSFVFSIINGAVVVCGFLFIYLKSKQRNEATRYGFYILTFFLPIIGIIVYLAKHKETGADKMKKCPSCGSLFPPEFTYCHKCNTELPEYDESREKRYNTVSTIVLVLFFALAVVTLGVNVVESYAMAETVFSEEFIDELEAGIASFDGRIDIDGVYYDAKGESYDEQDSVPFYTKDGKKVVYNNAAEKYQLSDGTLVDELEAFVDEDGNFVCADSENFDIFNADEYTADSYYFEHPYVDSDGTKYFDAVCASWNSDGKFIKSAEDIK